MKWREQAFGYKADSLKQAERDNVSYPLFISISKTFQRTNRKIILNEVSQYYSEKENIEDLSHEQAQEWCKMLKAITLVIVSKTDDKSKLWKGQCSYAKLYFSLESSESKQNEFSNELRTFFIQENQFEMY